ncbi:MAG TPA: UDP-N-acetylglucosamine 2-epimerase (non-hydrolyzing) [Nitriliruptorales bacterium]
MSVGPIAVVVGTRPELIKLATIVRALRSVELIHTGQHYDVELSDGLLATLELPEPATRLGVGGDHRGVQVGEATAALTRRFLERRPAAVIVQGDTNATLAGALAANAVEVPLVHVEAGLRSHDRAMPEEHNRILVDHLADLCCAPTATNVANLRAEAIADERIALTGNPIVDLLAEVRPSAEAAEEVARDHGLVPGTFVLATLHRPENVDRPEPLARILRALADLDRPVLLPLHPRTRTRVAELGLEDLLDRLHVVAPTGHGDFLALTDACAYVVTDSGGIQEEASVLARPVLVVRRSTERPEVLGSVAWLCSPDGLTDALGALEAQLETVRARIARLPTPYGDGHATRKIVEALARLPGLEGAGLGT